MINNIYVFGATSKIAEETIKNFAKDGAKFYLVGRNNEKLEIVKNDLLARGAKGVITETLDALDYSKHQTSIENASDKMGNIDLVYIAHGTLPDNEDIRNNPEKLLEEFNINCNSTLSLCSVASKYFESQGKGTLAVISSVAGERGRQSNFIYGAAKSAVTEYLSGLRNRLYKSGIKVITIKPGMVDTPMTSDMEKGLLFANVSSVGKTIYKKIKNGNDVVYVPGYWKLIMGIIKSIPESIFKKLNI
jgi:hypothetical protein